MINKLLIFLNQKYATEKSVTYFDLILKHNNLMKAATISINTNAFLQYMTLHPYIGFLPD